MKTITITPEQEKFLLRYLVPMVKGYTDAYTNYQLGRSRDDEMRRDIQLAKETIAEIIGEDYYENES